MISQEFKNTVQAGNIERAKIMLKNSLTMDLTFNQFKQMLEYALNYIPNIIETHDGTAFEPQENWNKKYASLLKVELVDNFSAERIEHIKEVQRVVYEAELKQQIAESESSKKTSHTGTNSNTGQQSDQSNVDSQQIITLIVSLGVGVASILLGVLKGWSIVTVATTAVIATVVIGGITYYIVKK